MRVNLVNQGGTAGGGFDIAGATLTGPLVLVGDPTVALEAATKKYIDNAVSSLNAGHITTGTLPVGRLPAFGGVLTNVEGTNVFTLNETGVVPGTYTKVTVTADGRVVSGTNLAATDIPALDWNKIVSGKPTTMDGYGITDGVKTTTDNLTGPLSVHANPTDNAHAANKAYVDNLVATSSSMAVGDTVRRTSTTTPTGFLRCNGASLSKTAYAALYAVVGDAYTTATGSNAIPGHGQYWKMQNGFNSNQSGDLTNWASAALSMPLTLTSCRTFVTKNRLYFAGGYYGSTGDSSAVKFIALDGAGNMTGSWTDAQSLPVPLEYFELVVTKNRAYTIGGNSVSTILNKTFTTAINPADGSIGTWGEGTTLPEAVYRAPSVVTNNRIYVFNGQQVGGGYGILTAAIDSNGVIGAWSRVGNAPASPMSGRAVVIKNFLYLIGYTNVIYRCGVNSDGTLDFNWTSVGNLPFTSMQENAVVTTNNTIYIIGGAFNGSYSSSVYFAAINADGSLGTWNVGTALPLQTSEVDVAIVANRIYLLGVSNSNGTIYQATFSGGRDDYTSYYDGTLTVVVSTTFNLPNTTTTDPTNIYTFIKY